MPSRKKRPSTVITNPRASRMPTKLGEFGTESVPPITTNPKTRPSEVFRSSKSVVVTAPERAQLPKRGDL